MLEGLDDVDWTNLHHAYGEATNVPEFVRGLLSDDEDTREWAIDALYFTIYHQGSVYDSTARAVPFLLELVTASEVRNRHKIIALLGRIARSKPYDPTAMPGLFIPDNFEEIHKIEVAAIAAAHDAVRQGIPLLLELLFSPDPMIQQNSATALFAFPEDALQTNPMLNQAWHLTANPMVKAACLFSLDKLDGITTDIREQLPVIAEDENEHLLLRFIAALILARNLPKRCHLKAVDLLRKVAGDWNGLNQIYSDISGGAWPSKAARAALKVLDEE